VEYDENHAAEERDDAGGASGGSRLAILDIAYGILFSPRSTLASLAEEPRLGRALVWYAVVGLVGTLGSVPELGRTVGGAGLLGLAVAGVAVSLVASFVVAGMWQILAELFGGRGRGVAMWVLMAYSSTPSIFAALGAVVSRLSYALWVLVQLALAVWVVVLEVLAVRANYRLSGGRAVAVVIIPVAAFLVLGLVAVAAVVSALPGVLGQPVGP